MSTGAHLIAQWLFCCIMCCSAHVSHRQTETDRQADKQTDRKTDRQTTVVVAFLPSYERKTNIYIYTYIYRL